MLRKQLKWLKVVTFVQLLDYHVVTQIHFVLEVVQNQLKCVGLVTQVVMVVYVPKVV
jgi:hypothetical protein